MTQEERVAALMAWGYSEHQAEFLISAALASGYFLRRQFHLWSGSADQTQSLIGRLLGMKHATELAVPGRQRLFHLDYHPMYAVLGDSASRHRRPVGQSLIRARVMGLDYILFHHWTTSGPERLRFLPAPDRAWEMHKRGVAYEKQPRRLYPMLLDYTDPENEKLALLYVDAGPATARPFRAWLRAHAEVFRASDSVRVIYLSEMAASSAYARFLQGVFQKEMRAIRPQDVSPGALRLIAYFEQLRDYRKGRLQSWTMEKLEAFRDAREFYEGIDTSQQFIQWLLRGDSAILGDAVIPLEIVQLEHNYSGIGQSIRHKSRTKATKSPQVNVNSRNDSVTCESSETDDETDEGASIER